MSANDIDSALRQLAHGRLDLPRELGLAGQALAARRAAELRAVAPREVRRRLEATGRGDVDDRHGGLPQQLARAAQAQLQVVPLWHAVQMPLEKPLDLAPRQPGGGGDLIEGERSLDILFHELCHLDQEENIERPLSLD